MSSIYVGCAGYSYDDWVGSFYPEGVPKGRRLEAYAHRFSFVELNFSYYAMPKATHLADMAESVPDAFQFSIKAHGSLTHERTADWRRRTNTFAEALPGLGAKLAGVLLQFPYSFHYTETNRLYLADLTTEMREALLPASPRLFVEFRNREWDRRSVLSGMEARRLHRVLVDAPALKELPASITGNETLPTNSGYLRLHGRNAETWWSGTNVTRYAYDYSAEELKGVATTLERLAPQEIFVVFNNHANARAPLNALELLKLIEVE